MGAVDQLDEHTFKVNFTGDGVAKLRDTVKEKLKEFMGDYTDDSLVEYVIVLLRNGRCKGEAKNELDVFLGDDSDSFVSWLWSHLASNLELYAQPQQLNSGDAAKNVTALRNHGKESDPQNLHSESDGEKSPKVIRSRRKREWKGLVKDDLPPLRSTEIDKMHVEDDNHQKVISSMRALSPRRPMRRKRNRPDDKRPDGRHPDGRYPDERLCDERHHYEGHRGEGRPTERRPNVRRPDERQHVKKAGGLESATSATRRLLQFAVRDAVGTTRPSITVNNPKFKRLRSVVSTSAKDASFDDFPQRVQSNTRMSNAAAIAIKAVAEAAEDVVKHSYGAHVFDRISPSMDVSEDVIEFGVDAAEDENVGHVNQLYDYERAHSPDYFQGDDYGGRFVGEAAMIDNGNGFDYHSASDNEGYGYDDVNPPGHYVSQSDQPSFSSVQLESDSFEHDQPVVIKTASRMIMSTPADGSTWKPLHYHAPREASRVNNQQHSHKEKSARPIIKENNSHATLHNGNATPATSMQNESQKKVPSITGPNSSIQPLEDAQLRTIFVNNVHFAATKESLSKHFLKFGEVLKVVIVTDAATGQPKGSAYVEFKQRVEAELALSSDSTSFMSRILKISRPSTDLPEAAPSTTTWPRVARVARFSRTPFPRGIHGAFRARPMIKPGARSLQWKRDSQITPAETVVPSPTSRNLTYVRTA